MANTYDVGDKARCTCTYTDNAGTVHDPAVVSLAYKDPSGNTTTLIYGTDAELVKSSTGVYYADIDVDEAGTWRVRCYATGSGQSAGESYFIVREQTVT